MQSKKILAIVINQADNVATAVNELRAGTRVRLENHKEEIILLDNVKFLHKFALRDIAKGEIVIKYGQPIGETILPIKKGEHVHIHNLCSRRGLTSKPR